MALTPKVDGWTIVIAGFWNRMIFSPEWLQAHGILPEGQMLAAELPADLSGPPRLSFDGIRMTVDPRRLILGTDAILDDRLRRMEEVAVTILSQLSHTPIKGVGINFQWTDNDPPGEVLNCFNVADGARLGDAGLEIRETQIVRKIADGERVINLSLTLSDDHSIVFQFNFHGEVTSALAAGNFLKDRVLTSRSRATEILRTVYHEEAAL